VLELRGGRKSFGDVSPIEGTAEAVVGRALRGHERMFARIVLDSLPRPIGGLSPKEERREEDKRLHRTYRPSLALVAMVTTT
jgi:hypothetical protein